jgi:hypothetical protein
MRCLEYAHLCPPVSAHTECLHGKHGHEKHGNPDTNVDICIPEVYRESGGSELEWQDGQPGDGVDDSHRKSPAGINEADDVGRESACATKESANR